MSIRRLIIFFVLVSGASPSVAQVSPGELSRAHSALEGITHCTDCHDRGAQIGVDRCLACHTDIKASIDRTTGLHAQSTGTNCESCHKEHLGLDAAITRFDRNTFDHATTGFALSGAHRPLSCEQCHRTANIRLSAVRTFKRSPGKVTLLGLDRQCASCHTDRHAGKLSSDCSACHTTASWKPAAGFKHDSTKFPLTGKHAAVECAACHPRPDSPAAPRLFSSKPFTACTPCHTSPHPAGFAVGKTCTACHTTDGWGSVAAFDHSVTRFGLDGRHAQVVCVKCHPAMERATAPVKVRFAAKEFADCSPCHNSPHGQGFSGRTCRSCHVPQSWSSGDRSGFDHRLTQFALVGAHVNVECVKCHSRAEAGTFADVFRKGRTPCAACHNDPHAAVFVKSYANDCARCHSESAFVPATFSSVMHDSTVFPLTGAHRAIPCGPCHRPAGSVTAVFRFASTRCDACHDDKHRGQFQKQMSATSCAQCHSTSTWDMRSFDHGSTGFPLVGQHAVTKCAECHRPDAAGVVQYVGTPTDCASCHADVHRGQFTKNGRTSCAQCHTASGWTDLLFRHDQQSSFALTGAHRQVACGGCHRPERAGDTMFVRFKPLPTACESCHQGKK